MLDAPIEIDQGPGLGVWKPENYENNFYGPSTLRFGIEHSRNVMTVRLAQDIGMPLIAEYAKRFGVYDNLPPYLSFALGAGETTLLRMVTAYAMIDNGGRRVKPTLIDRIQDRYGHTVYQARPARMHRLRRQEMGGPAGALADRPARAGARPDDRLSDHLDDGRRGAARHRGRRRLPEGPGKPVAGKTGTTNDYKDAWFIGFTPDIVCGVYIGFDKPKPLGRGMTGGRLAAPVVEDFMKIALAGKPAVPFRVPPGIKLVRVDLKTGLRAGPAPSGRSWKPSSRAPRRLTTIRWSAMATTAATAASRSSAGCRRCRPRRALGHRRALLTRSRVALARVRALNPCRTDLKRRLRRPWTCRRARLRREIACS